MASQPKIKPITEQTIVIVGASSGIGLATARLAAKKGANVVLASRNPEDLQKISAELNAAGGKTIAVTADVKERKDLEQLREAAIAKFGSIDTWVNNAGLSLYGKLTDTAEKDEREVFETNYWGIRNGSQVAVEALREKGGTLINLGSEVSARSVLLQGTYCATKHAVKAYTDALRMELELDEVPVKVSLIRPTAIDTPFPLHAKDALREGEPSLPAMAYSAEVVASAIVRCAEYPQRDVYIGGPARMNSFLESVAPRLMDLVMEKFFVSQQTAGTKIPHRRKNEALYSAPAKEGEESGGHRARVRKFSAYTYLSQRPNMVFAGFVGLGAAAVLIANARKNKAAGKDVATQTRAGW